MIIDEEDYLEHFGIKGMHWGSRRAPSSTPLTPAQQKKKKKRTARNVSTGIRLGIATSLIVAGIISTHKDIKLARLEPFGSSITSDILAKNGRKVLPNIASQNYHFRNAQNIKKFIK